MLCVCCFFFFKQKTAYEMRISDWSSDVCSSDLGADCGQSSHSVTDSATQGATGPDQHGRSPWPRSEQGRAADVERELLDPGGGDADLVRGEHGGRPDDRATLRGTQPGRELSIDVCRLERSEEHTSELQSLMRI